MRENCLKNLNLPLNIQKTSSSTLKIKIKNQGTAIYDKQHKKQTAQTC